MPNIHPFNHKNIFVVYKELIERYENAILGGDRHEIELAKGNLDILISILASKAAE